MAAYIARRILYLIPTWFGISILAFVLATIAPGDPAVTFFERVQGRPPTRPELARVRTALGLNGSLPERYVRWISHAVRGDLGRSYDTGAPVAGELARRLPATLELAAVGTALAAALALPLGVLAALRRNSLIDQALRALSLLAASIPSFWLAYLLIIVFSVELKLLPSFGIGGLSHLILPAVALALGEAALLTRLARSSMLEVLGEEYITTARSKGLSEVRVVLVHGLRNSLTAVVTQLGLVFGFLLAYSAVVETIFVWPGIGQYAVVAIGERDYPAIQGFVLLAGTVFILISLAVDLCYLWLDPRVTLRAGERDQPAAA